MIVVYTLIDEVRVSALAGVAIETLPPVYRERVSRMRSATARAHTCAGLQLLAVGLERIGLDRDAIQGIGKDANGRPAIADGPSFSISHSRSLVACALALHQQVGLDVEQRRSNVSPRLVQRIQPGHANDNALDFFDAWCAREAVVKASGRVGLARIQAVELTPRTDRNTADSARLDNHRWSLSRLQLVPSYAGCIASDQSIGRADVLEISLDPSG